MLAIHYLSKHASKTISSTFNYLLPPNSPSSPSNSSVKANIISVATIDTGLAYNYSDMVSIFLIIIILDFKLWLAAMLKLVVIHIRINIFVYPIISMLHYESLFN